MPYEEQQKCTLNVCTYVGEFLKFVQTPKSPTKRTANETVLHSVAEERMSHLDIGD